MTELRLLQVNLENDYNHTLWFQTFKEQKSYFDSRVRQTFTDFTYQIKDQTVRIPAHYDSMVKCNYIMYRNTNISKWFYAFITDVEYVNDSLTLLHIETDVMQTYMFDYTVKSSFIEREHVAGDQIGAHTYPEQLETGDYMCNLHTKANYTKGYNMVIVVGTTKTPDGDNVNGTIYNNIYSGIKYYAFPHNFEGAAQLDSWLSGFASDGAAEAITCMFLAPAKLVSYNVTDHHIVQTNTVDAEYINDSAAGTINTNIGVTTNQLNGYDPINNKLKCYPYRCLLVSNNNGITVPFKYEEFYTISGNTKTFIPPKFKIEGCLSPGCSVRMIPLNYKGIERNDEEAVNLGKFPSLNWNSDVYTNWLTQNGVNIGLSVASGLLQIAGGAALSATGAGALIGAGSMTSGALSIASTLGEVYQHSLTPPQSEGNLNCGDVITASGMNDFHFYDMSIKKEYAQIIDQYFTMFGYRVNTVNIPSFGHRENFWYIKTIDVNIDGAIPNSSLQIIKNNYNKGITFWKNPANIQDYTVSNSFVG